MKAIETKYRGYRFRSRLEARWAVFFDHLGVRWEYEKEGYDLGEHGWYLPDFYLPDLKFWVEVKPEGKISEEAHNKLCAVCAFTESEGMFVVGDPMLTIENVLNGDYLTDVDGYYVIGPVWDGEGWSEGKYDFCDWPYLFCICPACGKVGIEFDGRGARVCPSCVEGDKSYTADHPRLVSAALAARGARFEHGEVPLHA